MSAAPLPNPAPASPPAVPSDHRGTGEPAPAGDVYDVTIIGGGPAGLFAAFYAGMRRMRAKILDSLPELGGQLTALYPDKPIYDMPGFPAVEARELVRRMVEQSAAFHPTIGLNRKVTGLRQGEDGVFRLAVVGPTGAEEHLTRAVIIAAGAGAFVPKKLGKAAIDAWEGRGLQYAVPDAPTWTGRDVVIVGGGDSAVDWALELAGRAATVTLVHRRAEFRAHEVSVRRMRADARIRLLVPYELRRLEGGDRLERAVLGRVRLPAGETAPDGPEEMTLRADGVLAHLGFHADLGPIKEWGLQIAGGDIVVNSRMETGIPGVYACGDAARYEGKLKLIATGVAEAAVAVNHAKAFIDPRAKAHPGHSSDLAGRVPSADQARPAGTSHPPSPPVQGGGVVASALENAARRTSDLPPQPAGVTA